MSCLEEVKNIKIADFDYPLPDERIPRHPLKQRDACKLLESDVDGCLRHHKFFELPELIPTDALLVCNDTRVINARMSFRKSTGSKIEVFLLEPLSPEDYVLMFQQRERCRWSCMIGNLKRWKSGELEKKISVSGKEITLRATRLEPREGNCHEVEFEWDDPEVTFASVIEAAGYIPIPPYLKRESESSDNDDYQTIYAQVKGSVAAPTAGLHFTPELMEKLRGRGVTVAPLTLHVGAGTFQPVKSDLIGEHPMHTEIFDISLESLREIIKAKREGRDIVAVGTTSVRTLESLPYLGRKVSSGGNLNVTQWEAYEYPIGVEGGDALMALEDLERYMTDCGVKNLTASTSIMIAPGFRWNIVDRMVTNFHQPQSTLLLLVSSFLNRNMPDAPQQWLKIYNEALDNGYRFLSYGDACFLTPVVPPGTGIVK